MESDSLSTLTAHFCEKLECIRFMIDLKHLDDEDEDYQMHLDQLSADLDGLSSVLSQIKQALQSQREHVKELKFLANSLDISTLHHMLENIPAHLPKPQKTKDSKPSLLSAAGESEKQQVSTVLHEVAMENNVKKIEHQKPRKALKSVYIPSLAYVIVEEFESVPKYMKGRITYNQMNSAIDELNKVFSEKYKILGMKKTSLNDLNRKRYERFKQQESKDTTGEHFIVEMDIKEFSNFKMDNVGRSLLTILRHCGRMKEIRGGGLTRYACIEVY